MGGASKLGGVECIVHMHTHMAYTCTNTSFLLLAAASLSVLRIGSMEPGALLNDAYKEFEVHTPFLFHDTLSLLSLSLSPREMRATRQTSTSGTSKTSSPRPSLSASRQQGKSSFQKYSALSSRWAVQ